MVRRGISTDLLAVLLLVAGCSDAGDRLTGTVGAFADALSRGDAAAAAALTTDEAAASDTLAKLFASLGTDVHYDVSATQHKDDAATFTLAATWKFGPDKRTEWTYSTDGEARADGDDWTIQWNPATVAPGLGEGPLSYSTLVPQPAARVLDRTGAELLTQHVVTLVDLAPGADVNAVAALLNPITPTLTPRRPCVAMRWLPVHSPVLTCPPETWVGGSGGWAAGSTAVWSS